MPRNGKKTPKKLNKLPKTPFSFAIFGCNGEKNAGIVIAVTITNVGWENNDVKTPI